MVAIHPGIRPPELRSPLDHNPRDWSHKWDGHEPPRPGEVCFCIVLIGVAKRSKWQPRTPDAQVPVAFQLGSLIDWWGRHLDIVMRDVLEFNTRQMKQLRKPKGRITIWAVPAWGVCGFIATVRPVVKGGES